MDSIAIYLSSDSEDDNNCSSRMRYKSIRDKSNIFELSDTTFIKLFRLSKDAVKYLISEINDELPIRASSTNVPNILKLAATLRFCAQGSYQQSVGNDFNIGLSQGSVSSALTEVLAVLQTKVCPKWISYRQSSRDKRAATEYFYNITGFPGVIGCVDGTHVNIIRPTENEHIYFNRKGKHSLNTMIACDHSTRIMAVDSRYGGASHDSLVWSLSSYRQYLQANHNNDSSNYWLLGDSGYPLEPWLLTPFRATNEGSREARFNTMHSKTRNVIERCIGIFKSRFRCLLGARELHYAPKKASQIINVCATLHNICIHFRVPFEQNTEENMANEESQQENDVLPEENSLARQIRTNILNSLV